MSQDKGATASGEPTVSLRPMRQPSGYSSAPFYDATSLSPSIKSGSPSASEIGTTSLESTSSSDYTRHSTSELANTPTSSVSWSHSSEEDATPLTSEYCCSTPSEHLTTFESRPSPERGKHSTFRDVDSLGHHSAAEEWTIGSDDQSEGQEEGHASGWSTSPASSGAVNARPAVCSSPLVARFANSPTSGSLKWQQRAGHRENICGEASKGESDVEGPVRGTVYSPHIMLKDLKGDCSCWQERS